MQPRLPLSSARAVLLASAALALGACADRTARPGADGDIVWNTGRVTPSGTAPVSPAPATVPEQSSRAPGTDPCREYIHTVIIDGKEEKAYGRVCPQPDGSWRFEPPGTPQQSSPPVTTAPAAQTYSYPPIRSMFFFGSAFSFSDRHHRHSHRHYPRHRYYPRYR